jgi:hypothetical protein
VSGARPNVMKQGKTIWTPMVFGLADFVEPLWVNAMGCFTNRGTNDNKMYLEKTSIRGG